MYSFHIKRVFVFPQSFSASITQFLVNENVIDEWFVEKAAKT